MTKKRSGFPSIDKPWETEYERLARSEIKAMRDSSLYNYLCAANTDRSKAALQFFGKKIGYEELINKSNLIAECLSGLGLHCGDNILLCMTAIPETIEILLACSKLGLCSVMLNPTMATEQIISTIRMSDCKVLFCMDQMFSMIMEALKHVNIDKLIIVPATASLPVPAQIIAQLKEPIPKKITERIRELKPIYWKKFLQGERLTQRTYEKGDMPLAVLFTSGTTGIPKGIVHTNSSYVALVEAEYPMMKALFPEGYTFYTNIPTFIAAGLSYPLFVPLCMGITVLLQPKYNIEAFAHDLLKYKPSAAPATKSFWYEFTKTIPESTDLSFLKVPLTGGEAVNPADEDYLNTYLRAHHCTGKLTIGWGMSETNATVTSSKPERNTPGSVGIPLPGIIVTAFDTDTNEECTYNTYGELMVLTPCAMKEYYHNPELTGKFFYSDKQGRKWCKTGDVGFVNENGEVFVLGRADETYYSDSGKRFYLFDIENKICSLDNVERCKAAPYKKGEKTILGIHVILTKGCDHSAVLKQVRQYCQNNQDWYSIQMTYIIHEDFKLTPNGKIDRHQFDTNEDYRLNNCQ